MTGARLSQAAQLHRRAVGEFNVGEPARALATLRRAWRVLGPVAESDPDAAVLAARIWISAALDEAEVHGVDAGLAALERAQRWVTAAGDPTMDVLLHSQRGVIHIRRRQLSDALVDLSSAAELIDYAEPRDQCVILLNRGTLYLYQGELGRSSADLTAAAAKAKEIGDLVQEFKARHNLGYLEFLRGNVPRALLLMDEALALQAPVSRGIAFLDRARVLAESGLAHEAAQALSLAADTFRGERRGQDLGEAYVELARSALVSGDFATARRYAGAARDRFRRRGNERWRRSAELVLLQADLARGRPGSRLVASARHLKAEFEAEGAPLAARAAGLIAAEAYLVSGQVRSAADVLAGVGRPGRQEPITGRMHFAYVHARLAASQGRLGVAARRVRDGLAELSEYQASFGCIDLQTAAAVHGRRLAELGIDLALDSGRPAVVLAAAERARAVSSRLLAIRPPDDPVSAELLAELRQVVEALRPVLQDRAAATPLLRKRRDLERQIAARRWTLSGTGAVRPTASVDEIKARLGECDADMVVYLEAGGRLHAVIAGSRRLRLQTLGPSAPVVEHVRRVRADLDVLAQPRVPGGLRAAVKASLGRSLAVLDDALTRPLRADGRHLVIVSTGVLGQLPWGALPSLRGVPVVVAPSATAWVSATNASDVGHPSEVVALAGPDLERAEHEVAAIAATRGDVSVLTGTAANAAAFTAAMSKARIVHVAAHGVHQTENPLFSSVRLADGVVFAHELDQTVHTPEHVILSACELGLATVRPGDEALGLTSVLLNLGTRSVVAGVARVGDDVAAETMVAYHRHLASGRDSASALAAAQAATEVAPFVCFGAV